MIRRIEEGLQLRSRQIVDQRLLDALARDRVHLERDLQAGRRPILQEPEEGLERRKSGVSGTWHVRAIGFDVIQEVEDQLGTQLLHLDLAGAHPQPLGREADEQLEAVGIAVDGMTTGAAIAWQMLQQIGAEMRCERGHGAPPSRNASVASAICRVSTGVASRYQ